MVQEEGYHWLLPRVGEFVEPLLAELESEDEPRMQGWILELLGDARDVRAFPVFVRHLFSSDESVRSWAHGGVRGTT
ncbi:MAG: HEAT repeat domain-containing protein [Nitrososphaerota archaeon]